ncbi:MAG: hypothetical protein GC168_10900 [Candidatus Hydrogenedens sp.]|nr:hypothetical protein [Candidatus Hydrogenedens sp.]
MTREDVIVRHRWMVLLVLLVAGAFIGIAFVVPMTRGHEQPADILAAHDLAREGHWEEAMAMTRQFLLEHPEDPVGHFLLGQCYLYGPRLQFTQAAGELETALAIHDRTGSMGAWQGMVEPSDFTYRIYKLRAIVELRIVHESINLRLPRGFVEKHLLACLEEIRSGLELFPGDAYLTDMQTETEKLLDDMKIVPPPPKPKGPPPLAA